MTTTANTTIRVILLDIEGTTTPIDFVYEVLFPYARAHAGGFLAMHAAIPEVRKDLTALLELKNEDIRLGLDPPVVEGPVEHISIEHAVSYLLWLMDRDSKATPLKSIQGRIWQAGYESGDLKSEVFEDVPRALKRWREQGRAVCIYSSGSALAQKLLFKSTQFGDLTVYIDHYFDTNVGAKREVGSYRRISEVLKSPSGSILFFSDVTAELDAARSAGLDARLCIRPGNHPQPEFAGDVVHSFDEVLP